MLKYSLMTLSLLVVSNSTALAAGGACIPIDEGKLQCAITTISDCEALHDYPYARNLSCPAAFSAAQTMVSRLAKTLGVKAPTRGFFYYYQTIADPWDHAYPAQASGSCKLLEGFVCSNKAPKNYFWGRYP
jgi:hypothetical protein